MPKLYCHDCNYCGSDRTTCEHPDGLEFLAYMERCWKNSAVIDSSDCPGFMPVEREDDGRSEHE